MIAPSNTTAAPQIISFTDADLPAAPKTYGEMKIQVPRSIWRPIQKNKALIGPLLSGAAEEKIRGFLYQIAEKASGHPSTSSGRTEDRLK